MKLRLLAVIVLTLLHPKWAFCLEIPQDLRAEVSQAIKSGRDLYDAYLKGPRTDKQTEKEKSRIDDFCDFQYNAYVVGESTYFIAESPSAGGIVFGRHYRVSEAGVTKSTVTCYATPPPPTNTAFAFITHRISNTPTEFHVFLSLKHKNPIYVITKPGTWRVEGGKIAFVEKREGK